MSGQRFTFRTLPPEFGDLSKWRQIDASALSESDKERFISLKKGIEIYVRTGKLGAASRESGYSGDHIITQLNRCVTVAGDGLLWGWAGLLRGARTKEYVRVAPLPDGPSEPGTGFAGCFSKFLKSHEEVRRELDTLILKAKKKGRIHEARISVKNLTATFLNLCREHGVREDQYPLNVRAPRRSIARYMGRLIQQRRGEGTRARFGEEAARRLSVATGDTGVPLALAPYDVGGLDAHKIHCIGCVVVPGPAGPQPVAIERLWIVFLVDEFSGAILGHSVGIRTEISSSTVEEALISATSKWHPRKLTIPGLSYREGSGLPSGVIPELTGCFPAILKIDNASQHFAKRIAESARRRLGCALTWGPIGHWEHNAVTERLFKTLETYGFQRLPSTTGSNPRDPIKNEPVANATKVGITWEALLDVTDVLVADYNITGNRGRGGQSPLEVLLNQLNSIEPSYLPRILPTASVDQPELGVTVETRFIRGNQRRGRRPYVEIDRVTYTSPTLARSFGLVGTRLRVHIRESDPRVVNTFFESGQEFGSLRAQGKWGRTPHTREMRKQVMALVNAQELTLGANDDPIEKLLRYYASKAYQESLKRPKSVSRAATKLANAAKATGLPIPSAVQLGDDQRSVEDSHPARPVPSTIKSPKWKSIT